MQTDLTNAELVRITANIVTAHITNNPTDHSALGPLVANVHGALAAALGGQPQLGETQPDWTGEDRREGDRREAAAPPDIMDAPIVEPPPLVVPEVLVPSVPISESVKPDAITCLECGKKHKVMRLHLRKYHSLTPDEYREKWGLPRDYPMNAPNYSKARSAWAKNQGLGTLEKARLKGLETRRAAAATRATDAGRTLSLRKSQAVKPGAPPPRLSVAKAQAGG
jgi:predicted transcriptional regulator